MPCKIALFASGSGTNVENIANYFKNNQQVQISLILCNNPNAYVIERAKKLNIPCLVFNRNQFYNTSIIIDALTNNNIGLIVLAGFLWLVPDNILQAYNNKIINIHPALLPKYGGKGMYGNNVHKAVVANAETKTGITIHYVNSNYDQGQIIFQDTCEVLKTDTAEQVAAKVHALEYQHFPRIIDQIVTKYLS